MFQGSAWVDPSRYAPIIGHPLGDEPEQNTVFMGTYRDI